MGVQLSRVTESIPETVDDAFRMSLRDITRHGSRVGSEEDSDSSLEIFSYQTGMSRPRCRILGNRARTPDIFGVVGRFLWMLRGDDSLAPIAYYVPHAANYSPDGISVPGSSYGARIRRPAPGVDQLVGAIERLHREPSTRQAATVIWNPIDAVREPFDIPCAFGTLYHLRDGVLLGTTMMRSNKPSVLPINFFEFSMLAEIVASELKVPLGQYVHWTGVLQVPQRELPAGLEAVSAPGESTEMPPIPADPGAIEQVRLLVGMEERIRSSKDSSALAGVMTEADCVLHPYWYGFAQVLAAHWHVRNDQYQDAQEIAEAAPEYFKIPLERTLERRLSRAEMASDRSQDGAKALEGEISEVRARHV